MKSMKFATGSVLVMLLGIMGTQAPVAARSMDSLYGRGADQGSERSFPVRVVKVAPSKSIIVDLPRPASDVLVSSPSKADAVMRTAQRAYIVGMEAGETNVFFFDDQGNQILVLELHVEQDLVALRDLYHRMFPGADIEVESIGGSIVLSGVVDDLDTVAHIVEIAGRFSGSEDKVVNMVRLKGRQQVFLKVVIAEVSRSVAQSLGVNLAANMADFGVSELASARFKSDPRLDLNGGSFNEDKLGLSYIYNADNLGFLNGSAMIKALERNDLLRTLAEPTLTAVSGESASFLAGGEFPIPVSEDNDKITVEYKPFGVSLSFSPTVLSRDQISMVINTEISEPSTEGSLSVSQNVTVKSLKVRRANTTIELPSGGSLVIAGLIQETTKMGYTGIPGVMDMPVLGPLFRSREFQNNETEMIVLVTPYLAKPGARDAFSIPTDVAGSGQRGNGTREAPGLFERINSVYGVDRGSFGNPDHGKVGFIVR